MRLIEYQFQALFTTINRAKGTITQFQTLKSHETVHCEHLQAKR